MWFEVGDDLNIPIGLNKIWGAYILTFWDQFEHFWSMVWTNEHFFFSLGTPVALATWGAINKVPFQVWTLIFEKHCSCASSKRLFFFFFFFAPLVDFIFWRYLSKKKLSVETGVMWECRLLNWKKVCLGFSVQLQSGVVFKTTRVMKVVVQPVKVCCVSHPQGCTEISSRQSWGQ